MTPVDKMRQIEAKDEHGNWTLLEDMGRLEENDVFRFIEEDGTWDGTTHVVAKKPCIICKAEVVSPGEKPQCE